MGGRRRGRGRGMGRQFSAGKYDEHIQARRSFHIKNVKTSPEKSCEYMRKKSLSTSSKNFTFFKYVIQHTLSNFTLVSMISR
jgi:hypothetical protein